MGQSQSTSTKPACSSTVAATATGSSSPPDGSAIPGTDTTKKQPACKACCACPETKKVRDACIMENGEENCGELIEAHKKCMRDMGFNI